MSSGEKNKEYIQNHIYKKITIFNLATTIFLIIMLERFLPKF